MGHPFYALSEAGARLARQVEKGDLLLLYRSKRRAGFIGIFEATGESAATLVRFEGALRRFAIKIPWKPVSLCENFPIPAQSLLENLNFITNKKNFGMCLRSNLRRIDEADFRLIERSIREVC